MYQRILVAVDSSPFAQPALRTAGDMARLTGAAVHVVHVLASAVAFDTVMNLEEDSDSRRRRRRGRGHAPQPGCRGGRR